MSGLLSERTQRAEARLVEESVTARSRADLDRLYNWRALVKDRRLVILGDVHSLYVLFLKHGHGDDTALPPQSRYTPGEMVHFMVDETNPRMVPLTSPSFMERWAETVESNADKRARNENEVRRMSYHRMRMCMFVRLRVHEAFVK